MGECKGCVGAERGTEERCQGEMGRASQKSGHLGRILEGKLGVEMVHHL